MIETHPVPLSTNLEEIPQGQGDDHHTPTTTESAVSGGRRAGGRPQLQHLRYLRPSRKSRIDTILAIAIESSRQRLLTHSTGTVGVHPLHPPLNACPTACQLRVERSRKSQATDVCGGPPPPDLEGGFLPRLGEVRRNPEHPPESLVRQPAVKRTTR